MIYYTEKQNARLILKNCFNFFVRFINHIKLFAHPAIFVIFNFVDFMCAMVFI